MNIKDIKIPNKIMDQLVQKFFEVPKINRERMEENAINEMKKWEKSVDMSISERIPMMTMDVNFDVDILEEDLVLFMEESRKFNDNIDRKYPYFTLVSDNAKNGLKVYLDSYSFDTDWKLNPINSNDISCMSHYYVKGENDKYIFD